MENESSNSKGQLSWFILESMKLREKQLRNQFSLEDYRPISEDKPKIHEIKIPWPR